MRKVQIEMFQQKEKKNGGKEHAITCQNSFISRQQVMKYTYTALHLAISNKNNQMQKFDWLHIILNQ